MTNYFDGTGREQGILIDEPALLPDYMPDIIKNSESLSWAEIESALAAVAEASWDLRHNINVKIALTKMRTELWR